MSIFQMRKLRCQEVRWTAQGGFSNFPSVAVTNTVTKRNLQEKRVYLVAYTSRSQSVIKGNQSRNLGAGARLAGWLSGSCLASILTQLMATCWGTVLPMVDCVLLHLLTVKTISLRHAHRLAQSGHAFRWDSLLRWLESLSIENWDWLG